MIPFSSLFSHFHFFKCKTIEDPQGVLRVLPYLSVGLGCGIFGHGMGELILRSVMNNNPTAAKQLEIDNKDERNLAIANRARAKAYDMMVFVFGALILKYNKDNKMGGDHDGTRGEKVNTLIRHPS